MTKVNSTVSESADSVQKTKPTQGTKEKTAARRTRRNPAEKKPINAVFSAPAKTQKNKSAGKSKKEMISDSMVPPLLPKRNENKKSRSKRSKKRFPAGKLKIIPLGGLSEIGKNLTVIEYENDIILVDCGMGFPDDDMLGIDLVIPDITYLEKNADRVRAIFLTHGHEDHIGGIPYFLKKINVPIYGTRLTLGILENKLIEHGLDKKAKVICVNAGSTVHCGCFDVEFIHSNHSIADAVCLAISTPFGKIVHTGDFKIDVSPVEGSMIDIARLGQIGNEGVLLLMSDSTNAEHPGNTPSERTVGASLDEIFERNKTKRIIISTFSSNVHRVQQIINASVRLNRKVAITGRSMINAVGAAIRLGYMNVPDGVLININDISRYKPDQLTLITTGSQGESMSALYRITFDDHDKVELGKNDLIVISASAIPGNEKSIGKLINELIRRGVTVLHDAVAEVHVSGHACQEEIKMMMALTRPKYFMPVHGEYRHLQANRELGLYMGIPDSNIFISDIGKVLEIDRDGARLNGTVPSGRILVDGSGVGDVGNVVLRDRRHLGEDGVIIMTCTINSTTSEIVAGPEIFTRGFVYARESEALMEEMSEISLNVLQKFIDNNRCNDFSQMKNKLKEELGRFIYAQTKRRPMVMPIILRME